MRSSTLFSKCILFPVCLLLVQLAFFPATTLGKTSSAEKLIGTHYTGDSWAPAAWSNININKMSEDLAEIKANGFNTIILIIPWVGFQTSVEPIHYSEEYFRLLEEVMAKAQKLDLKVILRIGYTHEIGLTSTPDHNTRMINLFTNKKVLNAWQGYLTRLNSTAGKFDNFQFGFLTWEDFFLVGLTQAGERDRLQLASSLGFSEYIRKYSLAKLAAMYKVNFQHYSEVPIPAYDSPAISLFHEFWDSYLLRLQRESRKYFPKLSLEVRVDCDPSPVGKKYVCHENTFNAENGGGTTLIYYSPSWGSDNNGQEDSADVALKRFNYLLDKIRASTDNYIFIDQMNFVDNTPGFERNNRLKPTEVQSFIEKSFDLIDKKTIGYALWTMKDQPGNCIANGSFERGESGWKISNGTIYFDQQRQEAEVNLNKGGLIEQEIHLGSLINPETVANKFAYTLNLNAASQSGDPVELEVQIIDNQGAAIYHQILTVPNSALTPLNLSGIPLTNGLLQISNPKGAVRLDNVKLYYLIQENGIYDINGQPRPFRNAVLMLNKNLAASVSHYQDYYQGQEIHSEDLKGIFADDWVGEKFTGRIRVPKGAKRNNFVVTATVPNDWSGYNNTVTLYLSNTKVGTCSLSPGQTKCRFSPNLAKSSRDISFRVVSKDTFPPGKFTPGSKDARKLSFLLSAVGFE